MVRGTNRQIPTPPAKRIDVGTSIHNRFDIEIVDPVSGEVKQKAYAENVICKGLWSTLLAGNAYNAYIHYGDGSGTPSANDTSLFSFLGYASSSNFSADYDRDNQVYSLTKKAVLNETVAVGKTITEIGIASSTSATSLVTHAMLRDMNGNLVSLVKSDTDIFNIYATVFIHLTTPNGVRYLEIARGGCYTNTSSDFYSQPFRGYLSHLAGADSKPTKGRFTFTGGYVPPQSNYYNYSSVSYDTTNRTMTVSFSRLGATTYNDLRGIKKILLGVHYETSPDFRADEFAFEIDNDNDWYPKTEIRDEAVGTGDGVTCDFGTKFNFAENAVVKVDSVPVEAVVDFGCAKNSIGHYLRLIRSPGSNIGSYSGFNQRVQMSYTNETQFRVYRNLSGDPSMYHVYENTRYQTNGISKIANYNYIAIAVSNDLNEWIELGYPTNIPEQYQHYRYWKIWNDKSSDYYDTTFTHTGTLPTATNIHLTTPPPAGSVITIDYDAVCVGKDENHVFDFSVTFSLNEYDGV